MHGIKAYIPRMAATYVMVVNKHAFNYLPDGFTRLLLNIPSSLQEGLVSSLVGALDHIILGEAKLGFPAGHKGLLVRFLHGYLYPSFTGAQLTKFDSPEAVKMWEYLRELWQYMHPSSSTWDAIADPLLRGEV